MKLNRILFAALIAGATGSSITSCSESFLDENLTTAEFNLQMQQNSD